MKKLSEMFKSATFAILVLIGFFALFGTTYALSIYTPFGGSVKNDEKTKAQNIEDIENANYKCMVPGSSITVKPIKKQGQDFNFLIPFTTRSSTDNKISSNQNFLGLYEKVTQTITCIFQGTPPSTTTTTLYRLKLFGTSKR